MSIMGNGDFIGLTIPSDGMNARHLTTTDGTNRQEVSCNLISTFYSAVRLLKITHGPVLLSVESFHYLFSESDTSS